MKIDENRTLFGLGPAMGWAKGVTNCDYDIL